MIYMKTIFSALLVFIFCGLASAAPASSKSSDTWKTWKKGCDIYERGESLMLAGKYEEALVRFNEALKCFSKVKEEKPQWSRKIIDSRMLLCTKKIDSISKYLAQSPDARKKSSAPVETGARQNEPSTNDQIAIANLKKELEHTNAEIQKYKDKLFAAVVEVENAQSSLHPFPHPDPYLSSWENPCAQRLTDCNFSARMRGPSFGFQRRDNGGRSASNRPRPQDQNPRLHARDRRRYVCRHGRSP